MATQNTFWENMDITYQKILLKYTKETKVEGCFWKYFLTSCGYWVMDLENNYGIDKANLNAHYLYICTENELEKTINPYYIYFVKEQNTKNEPKRKEKNIVYFNWDDKNCFKKIVEHISPNKELKNLLDIFIDTNLWEVMWLDDNHPNHIYNYSNIDNSNNIWKEKIISTVQNVQKILEDFSNADYSIQYMKWYCRYLEWNYQPFWIKEEAVEEHRTIFKNLPIQAPIIFLFVNWSKLNLITQKSIFNMLNRIPKNEQTNEIITDMFCAHDEIYGDVYKIFDPLFKKWQAENTGQYPKEHYYPPLLYCKTTMDFDKNKKKKTDNKLTYFEQYGHILNYLHSKIKEDFISMEDIVFMYRCRKKLNFILWNYTTSSCQISFQLIVNEFEKQVGFYNLISKMTPLDEQPQRNQEILQLIRQLGNK